MLHGFESHQELDTSAEVNSFFLLMKELSVSGPHCKAVFHGFESHKDLDTFAKVSSFSSLEESSLFVAHCKTVFHEFVSIMINYFC